MSAARGAAGRSPVPMHMLAAVTTMSRISGRLHADSARASHPDGSEGADVGLALSVTYLQRESYSRRGHDQHLGRPPSRTPLLLAHARNLHLGRASGYPRRSGPPAARLP